MTKNRGCNGIFSFPILHLQDCARANSQGDSKLAANSKQNINICTKITGLLPVCFLHCVKSNGMLDPKKCTYCKVIAISSPSESKRSIRIIFIFVIRWWSSLKILYKFFKKFIYQICITQKLCNSFWEYSNMIIELALPVSSHLHQSCRVLDVWHQYHDNDWPVQRGQWAESQVCAYASCIPSSSSHPPPAIRRIQNLKPEQLYLIVTVTIF